MPCDAVHDDAYHVTWHARLRSGNMHAAMALHCPHPHARTLPEPSHCGAPHWGSGLQGSALGGSPRPRPMMPTTPFTRACC